MDVAFRLIRRKDDKEYPAITLFQICCGLQRHISLNSRGFYNIKILHEKDEHFRVFYGSLDSKMKENSQKENRASKPISTNDEDQLWQTNTINFDTSSVLSFGVFIYNYKLFSLRSFDEMHVLNIHQYVFSTDNKGVEKGGIKMRNVAPKIITQYSDPTTPNLLLSSIREVHCIKIGQQLIANSKTEKVLGVNFDNRLNFEYHIKKICKKASQKLYALSRISNFMSCNQRKIIMNAFISSQFNYCPLVWMCHSRSLNTQINNIHHRALSIVYRDHTSSFETLLKKYGSISIHHRNIQLLATEIFKTLNNLSPSIMSEICKLKRTTYALRTGTCLQAISPRITTYGFDRVSYLAPKIWNLVPNEIKRCKTLNSFRHSIKNWKPTACPCRLCKLYISNVGFI